MRYRHSSTSSTRGFTLIEMMVATMIMAITGTIIYNILYTGMVLFAKNSAVNIAHQEARTAVMQMEQDIHAAVSIPQLTDNANPPNAISGNGPAAGISFQLYASGPFQITPYTGTVISTTTGYGSGQSAVYLRCLSTITPKRYQRLIIPMYQIEMDIVQDPVLVGAVSGSSPATNDWKLTLGSGSTAANIGTNITPTITTASGSTAAVNIVCFITDRVSYVVQGNQLVYYGRQKTGGIGKVMANDLTTTTPFSIPSTPLGAPYYRFVAAINLSTADTSASNRKFRAANMFLNAMEPYRARLTTYQ